MRLIYFFQTTRFYYKRFSIITKCCKGSRAACSVLRFKVRQFLESRMAKIIARIAKLINTGGDDDRYEGILGLADARSGRACMQEQLQSRS